MKTFPFPHLPPHIPTPPRFHQPQHVFQPTQPPFVQPDTDIVTVDGRPVQPAENVYFLLNKPKAVICTNSDPQGRTKAVDLIDCPERIFCVARLDAETTGAIILTNDSRLANRLTHPKYAVPKTPEFTLLQISRKLT